MRVLSILFCAALIAPTVAAAPGDGAQAYRDAAARRGIAVDVAHPPADAPLPSLTIAPPPPPPTPTPTAEARQSGGGTTATWLSALVLAAALVAAIRFGGARTASFAQTPAHAIRRRAAPAAPPPAPTPPDLARIAAMADRRQALEALWLAALARAAALHDLTIGRSWTARDALRRVPGGWPHRQALIRIARAAELAHFGGRDVPEDQFRALLDAAAPIFAGRRA